MIYYRPVFSSQTHAEGLKRSPKDTHHTRCEPLLTFREYQQPELWSHPMTAHTCTSSPSSQRPPLLDTSHHTESDNAQLHFHQQDKPDRSNLTSASSSTGYLSICFWFIFLHSKEEIMIYNQKLGSTADLLGKIEDSLKNIASHL